MAIAFDGATKRITLDSTSVSAATVWSRWVDWHEANPQWPLAFRQVGGDDLGGGLYIPPYYFLQNGWRVRPMEANHNLTITGNLFVEGGGVPVVSTLGTYQVNVNYTVPVQAQGIATGGGGAPTAEQVASAVWAYINRTLTSAAGLTADQAQQLAELHKIHGLLTGTSLVVSPTQRQAGSITQSISEAGGIVTVTRSA